MAAKAIAAGAKKISAASNAAAEGVGHSKSNESLSSQKTKLRQLMLKLDAQIVVVIDDIDRLGDDEVLLVLRLIKANADFPNLTYLLLFQRDIVERAV
jgi:predicted KAP-like P-loop ATPase